MNNDYKLGRHKKSDERNMDLINVCCIYGGITLKFIHVCN
jgi:hypothetical protein